MKKQTKFSPLPAQMNAALSRRDFIKVMGIGAGAAAFSSPAIVGAANAKVIVVGGGFAGATVAKYLKMWGSNIDVTLIEPNATYYSPILSNLVLNGQKALSDVSFNYNTLRQQYGVTVMQDRVTAVNGSARQITLSGGTQLSYDRLVLAPGIDFETVSGLDSSKVLHGWQSGSQVTQLKAQIDAMPAGGTFAMTIPKAPYRCPPGPYERSCVVADYLKANKPGARVVVLDANADILVEPEIIRHAYDVTYAGIIDYVPNATLQSVDSNQLTATTSQGSFNADVLNVIPNQKAAQIIFDAGLVNDSTGRWAGVNPLSYESTQIAGIHVIGDSQGTGQPKAGHIANAEAKVCADAILRLLSGEQPYAAPKTNSACYTPISSSTASWLSAVFEYNSASGNMEVVSASSAAATEANSENYQMMGRWSQNLFADTFS